MSLGLHSRLVHVSWERLNIDHDVLLMGVTGSGRISSRYFADGFGELLHRQETVHQESRLLVARELHRAGRTVGGD